MSEEEEGLTKKIARSAARLVVNSEVLTRRDHYVMASLNYFMFLDAYRLEHDDLANRPEDNYFHWLKSTAVSARILAELLMQVDPKEVDEELAELKEFYEEWEQRRIEDEAQDRAEAMARNRALALRNSNEEG